MTIDAVTLLKSDHRLIEALFERCRQTTGEAEKASVITQIAAALTVHTLIEGEIFYPGCAEKGVAHATLEQAQVEHGGIRLLIEDLMRSAPRDELYDATVTVLHEYVLHHVSEAERDGDGLFAKALRAGVDMDALGRRLWLRRAALMIAPDPASRTQPAVRPFQPQSPASRSAGWYGDPFAARQGSARPRRVGPPDKDGHPDRGGWLEGDPTPAQKSDGRGRPTRDRDER
jgi:hypothetical protein